MIATLLLSAALTCQLGPGVPGVLGGPIPIPPGATPAEVRRIQGMNRQLRNPAAARAYGRVGQTNDLGPRLDFLPGGGMLITPKVPMIQPFGLDYRPRVYPPGAYPGILANGVLYPGFMPIAPVPNGFTGPPALQRRKNPIGMFGQPNP